MIGRWSFRGNQNANEGHAFRCRLKGPEKSLVERRALWAQKTSLGGVVAPYETKRLQFASMSIYFQYGHEKREHDRGIDKER
jgi:hypothetical protein